MKKLLFSILAVAVMASCTKSDVIYDEPSEIGFAPASKIATKAVVSDVDYPDGLNMYVFAMAGAADAAVPGGFNEVYFANAEFTHRTDLATDVFGGMTNKYYWPNVKKLIFSGYSKSGNVASLLTGTDAPSYTTAGGILIKGYEPGKGTSTVDGDNDLMWFPTTTSSYGKQTAPIEVKMKHACSWITIKITGDEVTGKSGTSWKIHKLQLSSVSKKGNVTLGDNAAWSNLESASTEDVFDSTDGISLTTGFVDYTDGSITQEKYSDLVVIPQKACTLHITYSYSPSTGITIEETVPVSLNFEAEVNANSNKWAPGKHYVYEITIGTSEILIDPSADVWILHS